MQRQLFICSAIEKCRETVNCCHHKTPHIKDERCVPRECRYAAGAENIDCDPFDPAHPRAPVKIPVAPAKTVEQKMKEDAEAEEAYIQKEVPEPKEQIKNGDTLDATINGTIAEDGSIVLKSVSISKDAAKELDIKEAVKKASQKQSKAPKKTQGRKKGE